MKLIHAVKQNEDTAEMSFPRRPGGLAAKGDLAALRAKAQTIKLEGLAGDSAFALLPKLLQTPVDERGNLFLRKVEACTTVFEFHNNSSLLEKEAKKQTLFEIVEYVKTTCCSFTEVQMQAMVSMVGANIFRPLQVRSTEPLTYSDLDGEEAPLLEPIWPHLQLVYECFFAFLSSTGLDPKVAKRHVDRNFVRRLLALFISEDPRERDYLKTILHRIYGRFVSVRSFIRRNIQHVFFRVIYECEMYQGVAELLEIFGSIINGFALPLKDDHKDFLTKALIPLHKVKSLAFFHNQLTYCMTQYVEKDPRLAFDIITAILRYWPVPLNSKQVLFLNGLEEVLMLTQSSEFHRMQEALSRRLATCITCPHSSVAERALFFWNNDHIVTLINQHRQDVFPVIVSALHKNSNQHWSIEVCEHTSHILQILREVDPQLFGECSAKHRAREHEEELKEVERQNRWSQLKDMLAQKQVALTPV